MCLKFCYVKSLSRQCKNFISTSILDNCCRCSIDLRRKLNSLQNTYQYHLCQTNLHSLFNHLSIFISIIRKLFILSPSVSSVSQSVNLLQVANENNLHLGNSQGLRNIGILTSQRKIFCPEEVMDCLPYFHLSEL